MVVSFFMSWCPYQHHDNVVESGSANQTSHNTVRGADADRLDDRYEHHEDRSSQVIE